MSRTRKVKRTNRKRTNRKRSRINNKRTKRKSRMKRGGYPGKELINRLRGNSTVPAWIKVKDHNSEFLTLENGDPVEAPRPSAYRAYKVSRRITEGRLGRKKKYLLLNNNPILKILEENADNYDIYTADTIGKSLIGKAEVGREFDARHT